MKTSPVGEHVSLMDTSITFFKSSFTFFLNYSHGKFGSLFPKESQLRQSRATQPYLMTSLVCAVFNFVCDHTTGVVRPTRLRQMDMGSLTCAHTFWCEPYSQRGVRNKRVCTSCADSEGQENYHGIESRVFGFEFGRSSHIATPYPPSPPSSFPLPMLRWEIHCFA